MTNKNSRKESKKEAWKWVTKCGHWPCKKASPIVWKNGDYGWWHTINKDKDCRNGHLTPKGHALRRTIHWVLLWREESIGAPKYGGGNWQIWSKEGKEYKWMGLGKMTLPEGRKDVKNPKWEILGCIKCQINERIKKADAKVWHEKVREIRTSAGPILLLVRPKVSKWRHSQLFLLEAFVWQLDGPKKQLAQENNTHKIGQHKAVGGRKPGEPGSVSRHLQTRHLQTIYSLK